MNIIKKYTGKSLWLAGLMLTTLIAGCSGGGSSSNTDPEPVITPSLVVETIPMDTAIDVALNSRVIVTFSEEMDEASFTDASFTVSNGGVALAGILEYDTASKTATFATTLADPFILNTLYTATLSTAVKRATGVPMEAPYVWRFTTSATGDSDNTAPEVVSTDPANLSTTFLANRSVIATFDEAIHPATVNDSTFTLKTTTGGAAVPGVVSYNNKVATFNPTNDLALDTSYTATLKQAIKDAANNALVEYEWTFTTSTVVAKGPAPVNLSTAENFVILTKTGITNVPTSAITGNIGASPITAAAMDTVNCSEMVGTTSQIYGVDAAYTGSGDVTCFNGTAPDKTLVDNAVLDMGIAYTDAAGRTGPNFTELYAGDISGQTLYPGLYKWGTNVWIYGDVTLSGGANDVWIFQIAQDVIQASGTNVKLIGGALAKNVFWQVGGGAGVDINTYANFQGVVLAQTGVTVKTGATVNGRLLSQTAVTLQSNEVTQPAL